jgi:hypothetical protein
VKPRRPRAGSRNCARAGFFERKDKSTLRHPIPIGNRDGTIATNKGNA